MFRVPLPHLWHKFKPAFSLFWDPAWQHRGRDISILELWMYVEQRIYCKYECMFQQLIFSKDVRQTYSTVPFSSSLYGEQPWLILVNADHAAHTPYIVMRRLLKCIWTASRNWILTEVGYDPKLPFGSFGFFDHLDEANGVQTCEKCDFRSHCTYHTGVAWRCVAAQL